MLEIPGFAMGYSSNTINASLSLHVYRIHNSWTNSRKGDPGNKWQKQTWPGPERYRPLHVWHPSYSTCSVTPVRVCRVCLRRVGDYVCSPTSRFMNKLGSLRQYPQTEYLLYYNPTFHSIMLWSIHVHHPPKAVYMLLDLRFESLLHVHVSGETNAVLASSFVPSIIHPPLPKLHSQWDLETAVAFHYCQDM